MLRRGPLEVSWCEMMRTREAACRVVRRNSREKVSIGFGSRALTTHKEPSFTHDSLKMIYLESNNRLEILSLGCSFCSYEGMTFRWRMECS